MLHKIFDNNWVAIRQSKVSLKINKPEYIGMCVLELRKVLVYEFHHDYIKKKYEKKIKTISLMFNVSLIV